MTSSGDGDDPGWRPARFAVGPPSPNPFRATTALGVDIPATGDVVIEVYDIHGRLVRRIAEGAREPGRYSVAWDGRDERGAEAAAGIYLFRMRGAGFESVRKGIRIR